MKLYILLGKIGLFKKHEADIKNKFLLTHRNVNLTLPSLMSQHQPTLLYTAYAADRVSQKPSTRIKISFRWCRSTLWV